MREGENKRNLISFISGCAVQTHQLTQLQLGITRENLEIKLRDYWKTSGDLFPLLRQREERPPSKRPSVSFRL